jgi:wyosine [tRNA(Phe)-imidazoG37] synthetase (radical SAM superfamily)
MISFGPVPSRRLGKSLGINNIPSTKVCTYSCVYCQVGITSNYSTALQEFYAPKEIFSDVRKHLESLQENDRPDYLTFVSNGEPTLDINLGKTIGLLKMLGFPVAVITNASLLKQKEVRKNLNNADWVSVKVDANDEEVWKTINRPHKCIHFDDYIKGLLKFSKKFKGTLTTETMLIEGINNYTYTLLKTADLISCINPAKAYISIPTRPPAIHSVKVPSETIINKAWQIFHWKVEQTELMLGFEGIDMGSTGNPIEDITNICTVHPIREDTMQNLLGKYKGGNDILDILIKGNYIERVKYQSQTFYIRKFHVQDAGSNR